MKLEPGALLGNGKYQLTRHLGEGSQADVWSARQLGLAGFSKDVVLKCLDVGAVGPAHQQLMYREARLAASLRHPNIVEIYDVGEDEDLLYIAMEYIQGTDLDVLLQQSLTDHQRPLPWAIATAIGIEVCKALYHAHVQAAKDDSPLHLVHRDLKPGNILLSEQGYVKVIDFGIAKATHPKQRKDATHAGKLKGTPAYMSPEQIMEKPIDGRSDLYSLGTILFELYTGQRPFKSEELFTMLIQVVQEEPPTPHSLRPDLPPEVNEIVSKLLAKKPEQRFQNARAVRRALESVLRAKQLFIEPEDLSAFYHSLRPKERAHGNGASNVAATQRMDRDPSIPSPAPTYSLPDEDVLSAHSGISYDVVSFGAEEQSNDDRDDIVLPDDAADEHPTESQAAQPPTPTSASGDVLPASDEPSFHRVDIALSSDRLTAPTAPSLEAVQLSSLSMEEDEESTQATDKFPAPEGATLPAPEQEEEEPTTRSMDPLGLSDGSPGPTETAETTRTADVAADNAPPTKPTDAPGRETPSSSAAPASSSDSPTKDKESPTSALEGLDPSALLGGGGGFGLDDLDSIFASLEAPAEDTPDSKAASMLSALLPSSAPVTPAPADRLGTTSEATDELETPETESPEEASSNEGATTEEPEPKEPHNPDPTTPTFSPPSLKEAMLEEEAAQSAAMHTAEAPSFSAPPTATQPNVAGPHTQTVDFDETPEGPEEPEASPPDTKDTPEDTAENASSKQAVLVPQEDALSVDEKITDPAPTEHILRFEKPPAVAHEESPNAAETPASREEAAAEKSAGPSSPERATAAMASFTSAPGVQIFTQPLSPGKTEPSTPAATAAYISFKDPAPPAAEEATRQDTADNESFPPNAAAEVSNSETALEASPFAGADLSSGPPMPPATGPKDPTLNDPSQPLNGPQSGLANYEMAALDDLLGYDDADRTMASPSPPSLLSATPPPSPNEATPQRISLGIGQSADAMKATIEDGLSVKEVMTVAKGKSTLEEPSPIAQILDAHEQQGVAVNRPPQPAETSSPGGHVPAAETSSPGAQATAAEISSPGGHTAPTAAEISSPGATMPPPEDEGLFYLDPNEKTALNEDFAPHESDISSTSSALPRQKKSLAWLWGLLFLGVVAMGCGVYFFFK